MADFNTPEFLDAYTTETIYEKMREILPEDIDTSEGSHAFNFIMPTALVLAEMCEVVLPQVIEVLFPEWSYGEYLDAHAQTRGMARKAATAATGELVITGDQGTEIPEGSVFSTVSMNDDDPSISYETTEAATIPEDGVVTVGIICQEVGSEGNTSENTIVLVDETITGLTAATNLTAVTGGTDEESDEDLIERIMEYDQDQGDSYVGNVSDYKRWAESVSGIGNATIVPASDNSGTIQIVLTDMNGDPASQAMCEQVYDYIMSPDDPEARLAPINAIIEVTSPSATIIGVTAIIELEAEAVLADIEKQFITAMNEYLEDAMTDGEIKITKVSAILSAITGVNDFGKLSIGKFAEGSDTYVEGNIPVNPDILPAVNSTSVAFEEGDV